MNKYEQMLKELKERMQTLAGAWNGDEPGVQEDTAHLAMDIIAKVGELEELLLELEEIES
jgi:hypothetical protein